MQPKLIHTNGDILLLATFVLVRQLIRALFTFNLIGDNEISAMLHFAKEELDLGADRVTAEGAKQLIGDFLEGPHFQSE